LCFHQTGNTAVIIGLDQWTTFFDQTLTDGHLDRRTLEHCTSRIFWATACTSAQQ